MRFKKILTKYYHESREGGLFADTIGTFLKLKADSSVYPAWVRSPVVEKKYIESLSKSEVIRLYR
jgi:hypothetical protein